MATETQARPCFQTTEKQTAEHINLYRQCNLPGDLVVVTVNPAAVQDNTSTNGEIRVTVAELTNGHAAGVSGMHAEDLKGWLQGIKSE